MSRDASPTPLLAARSLVKVYGSGATRVEAVRDVSLDVLSGSFVVVRGRSGSGKTTLLNLLGGLDTPTSGTVTLDGDHLGSMGDRATAELRRTKIGFIFQAFGLIPILSAAENVEVPMRLVGTEPGLRTERSRDLLELVGLGQRADHRPDELSGGEQQRVAIARAIANRPRLLMADEPTGQLDSRTGQSIVDLIRTLVLDEGITAILATHDPAPLVVADRVLELSDGRLVSDRLATV